MLSALEELKDLPAALQGRDDTRHPTASKLTCKRTEGTVVRGDIWGESIQRNSYLGGTFMQANYTMLL